MNIIDYLNKAANKCGLQKERIDDYNTPTDSSRIVAVTCYGGPREIFLASGLLLKKFREEIKSKFVIAIGYPGFGCLFPYVNEYWSGIKNPRELNKFFDEVVEELPYYDKGITDEFWNNSKRFLPEIPSSVVLNKNFLKEVGSSGGYKVFIYPTTTMHSYKDKLNEFTVKKEFWVELLKFLVKNGYKPVVYQGHFTYNLMNDFSDCIYFVENDIGKVLAGMRLVGCVLDVFSDISRFAIMARCPFVMVDERTRFFGLKEYELDDLFAKNIPRQYIYSFSNIIESGSVNSWENGIFSNILLKLEELIPNINRDILPSTKETCDNISYDGIRKIKSKRLGIRLLKVPKSK